MKDEVVRIRPIERGESALLAVFLYHAIFLPTGTEPPPFEIILGKDLAVYIDDFGKDGDYGVCAVKNDTPVGAAWTRVIQGYGHIDETMPELAISVLPEYRSQGIGTAMLDALFDLMRKAGVSQTSLSVQKANKALGFYQRSGYQIWREREDEYIMIKRLT